MSVLFFQIMASITCVFCSKEEEDGRNAAPVAKGRCCYDCYRYRVVPHQMMVQFVADTGMTTMSQVMAPRSKKKH